MNQDLKKYHSWIESEIKKKKFGQDPELLYEPLRYIMGLGGKRLRPLLTMLAYALYKANVRKITRLAIAVETFHNFTLLHDDIMDNAPLRRGRPSVHKKWNTNTAILAGDVMQVKVYDMLLEVEDAKLKEVLRAFNTCATKVCEGQQLDMAFETMATVTEARYLEMIRLKTAVLLGFSLEFGAILADAPAKDKKALREFGIHAGIGFQLKDDLLDVYASKGKFGKQVGGDILANKKTFLLIQALQRAKGKTKDQLEYWISARNFNGNKKITEVTKLYDALGIYELTQQKINSCFQLAIKSLNKLNVSAQKKNVLKDFVLTLMERQA